ncbi:MAG: TIGR03009 domain-containing protein [Planctomycetales bacterium]|nr:TIGR03009 domain-containing protein [Planctomycetales bacterium]
MARTANSCVSLIIIGWLAHCAIGQQPRPQAGQGLQPQQQQAAAQQIPIVQVQDAVAAGQARVPQQPFPDLTPAEVSFVDQVLNVWETRTASIKRYSADFRRWQYDSTKFEDGHYTVASGILKYETPDRGVFKVETLESIAQKGPPAVYRVDPRRPYGEHWICDGEWVHVLDHNEKKAQLIQLSPDQRGNLASRSPLPFLFGVKAAEVKQRYWIRPLNPPNRPEELWLEVYPKFTMDAGNYSRVQVVLDRKDILPKGLIVFMPEWTPQQPNREVYQFDNRETDSVMDALRQRLLFQNFIQTKLGSDWEIVKEPYIPPEQTASQPAADRPLGR